MKHNLNEQLNSYINKILNEANNNELELNINDADFSNETDKVWFPEDWEEEDYLEDMEEEQPIFKYPYGPEPLDFDTICELTGYSGKVTGGDMDYGHINPLEYDVPSSEELYEAVAKVIAKEFAEENGIPIKQVEQNTELLKAFITAYKEYEINLSDEEIEEIAYEYAIEADEAAYD